MIRIAVFRGMGNADDLRDDEQGRKEGEYRQCAFAAHLISKQHTDRRRQGCSLFGHPVQDIIQDHGSVMLYYYITEGFEANRGIKAVQPRRLVRRVPHV